MTTLYTYYANVQLSLEVSVKIEAASMEDAVLKAANLQETDAVKFLGDYNDGSIQLTGVFRATDRK